MEAKALNVGDRVGMYVSAAMVAAVAGVFIFLAVDRVTEVAQGGAIPVEVPLDHEPVTLPLGPDGAAVEAYATVATVGVEDPAAATLFALYAQPIYLALAVTAGMFVAAVFFVRLSRGRAFERGTAVLAYAGASILIAGWFGYAMLTNMTTNGALSALSDHTYEAVRFEIGIAPAIAVLLIGAVGAALEIGERLQRDTEGLV